MKHEVPQGVISRAVVFHKNVQDLLSRINTVSKAALFADDTTVIISSNISILSFSHKHSTINKNKCFTANNLTVNPNNTNSITFTKCRSAQRTSSYHTEKH